MRLYTRARVVKSNAVEVSVPRIVECRTEEFQHLGKHLSVVHERSESLPQEDEFPRLEGEEKWEPSTVTVDEAEHEKAKEIIAEAEVIRAQAQAELEKARGEAAEILEKARVAGEEAALRLREEVSHQAYEEGYARGLAQGFQEGTAQGEQEAERMKAEARDILKLAQKAAHEEWSKVDETLLRLALKVAERILRVHILEHPERLLQRIRDLSLLPEEREGWKLHVSTADYQWLSQCSEEITIPLLEDQTLTSGDCFLECTEGIFDARVEVQLERCEQLLREELRHDRLE
ncbi:flagellar assembly protein FliH [Desulfitobacterium hafniense]|uniref:Flagellar assembly protein FliH n=1 Tax=Desulfitobacterium hafniense TaxID=49338 RepID=A0A0W1JLH2_DESHA|nr:FliH/SctL family protein [Desulfitobacterium hafniense]KTE91992.1 flagellar assembly protein FliH [Desulfitobacterium hafniense]